MSRSSPSAFKIAGALAFARLQRERKERYQREASRVERGWARRRRLSSVRLAPQHHCEVPEPGAPRFKKWRHA